MRKIKGGEGIFADDHTPTYKFRSIDKKKYKWGIFNKKEFTCSEVFLTKEQAEERLSHYQFPNMFEVWKIIAW